MFFNSQGWSAFAAPEAAELFKTIHYRSNSDNRAILARLEARAAGRPFVTGGRRRSLPFYKGFELIELEIDIEAAGIADEFQLARLYTLLSDHDARILTGDSSVIHQLNQTETGTNGSRRSLLSFNSIDDAKLYLEFFCTFVVGDEGPFILVETFSDLSWPTTDAKTSPDGMQKFDMLVAQRRKQWGWIDEPLVLTADQANGLIGAKGDISDRFKDELDAHSAKQVVAPTSDLHPKIKPVSHQGKIEATAGDSERGKQPSPSADLFTGTVWYGGYLFESRFKVFASGMVEMVDDSPIGAIESPRWQTIRNYALVAKELPRRTIDAMSFTRDILGARSGGDDASDADLNARPSLRLANLRVEGDVDLRNAALECELELSNVEFLGELNLSGLTSSLPIRLVDVSVLGRFIADGAELHSLETTRLRVFGLYNRNQIKAASPIDSPGLSMRNAYLRVVLKLNSASIDGGADLNAIHCHGFADLSGLNVSLRSFALTDEEPYSRRLDGYCGLRLAEGRFDRGLTLGNDRVAKTPTKHEDRAAEILGSIDLRRCSVAGDLELTSLKTKGFSIHDGFPTEWADQSLIELLRQTNVDAVRIACRNRGQLLLAVTRPSSIMLSNADVKGRLLARNIAVRGDLSADGLKVGGVLDILQGEIAYPAYSINTEAKTPAGTTDPIRRHHVRAAGQLGLEQVSLGSLTAAGISIGADVALASARIAGWADFGSARIAGGLSMQSAQIEGFVSVQLASIGGDLAGWNATIDQGLSLGGADIKGDVNLLSVKINAGMLDGNPHSSTWRATRIGGQLVLSGAQIANDVRFCGATIAKGITAITGKFSRIQLRGDLTSAPDGKSEKLAFTHTTLGPILFQTLTAMNVDLYAANIEGGVRFDRIELWDSLSCFNEKPKDYLIFNDDSAAAHEAIPKEPAKVSTTVKGRIAIRDTTTGGDLDLRNIRVMDMEGDEEQVGEVSVYRCTVKKDLLIGCLPTLRPAEEGERFVAMVDRKFKLDGTEVIGDANLSGLESPEGISAVGLKVGRSLRLHDGKADGHPGCCAKASGDLNFEALDTQFLELGALAHDHRARVNLQSAKFRKFDVELPMDRADLRGADWTDAATNWLLDRNELTSLGKNARELREELFDLPFNSAIYSAVERKLRVNGKEREADFVHIDMRWRSILGDRTGYRPGAWGKNLGIAGSVILRGGFVLSEKARRSLIGLMTGHWRRGDRLLRIVLLPLLLLSLFVISDPANIAPTSVQLQEAQAEVAGLTRETRPAPAEWNGVEIGRLMITYHVPIISVVDSPRWELASDGPMQVSVGLPGVEPVYRGEIPVLSPLMTPATYGLLVRLISWIAWPLFLIGVATNLQRRGGD